MAKNTLRAFISATMLGAAAGCASVPTDNNNDATATVRPLIIQNSMNVYRRFEPELRPAMIAFYNDVLGLKPLAPIDLETFQMILFEVGGGQIKLASGLKEDRQYHLGAVDEGTGIRLFTLYFDDEDALSNRFADAGFALPEFKDSGDGDRAALVKDPGGFTLKLVIVVDAAAANLGRLDIGVNVTDLDAARGFYERFIGLDSLPPKQDALLGVMTYPYRHGETTINLWSTGGALPADTGSAGIQYVVRDAEAVDRLASARHITVETPLGMLENFNLKFLWLNDPDGVTNYFAEIVAASPTAE